MTENLTLVYIFLEVFYEGINWQVFFSTHCFYPTSVTILKNLACVDWRNGLLILGKVNRLPCRQAVKCSAWEHRLWEQSTGIWILSHIDSRTRMHGFEFWVRHLVAWWQVIKPLCASTVSFVNGCSSSTPSWCDY